MPLINAIFDRLPWDVFRVLWWLIEASAFVLGMSFVVQALTWWQARLSRAAVRCKGKGAAYQLTATGAYVSQSLMLMSILVPFLIRTVTADIGVLPANVPFARLWAVDVFFMTFSQLSWPVRCVVELVNLRQTMAAMDVARAAAARH